MYARVDSSGLDDLDDAALVEQFKGGNDEALHVLLRRHSDALYRFCLRLAPTREEAEDICQESLVRAIDKVDSLNTGGAFRTWLFRIARNLSTDSFRARRRICRLPDGDETPPLPLRDESPYSRVELDEEHRSVSQAFRRLAKNHQQVLLLREVEGLSYADIAQRLDISQSAVETLLFRARRRLRQEYSKSGTATAKLAAVAGLRTLALRLAPVVSGGPAAAKIAVAVVVIGAAATVETVQPYRAIRHARAATASHVEAQKPSRPVHSRSIRLSARPPTESPHRLAAPPHVTIRVARRHRPALQRVKPHHRFALQHTGLHHRLNHHRGRLHTSRIEAVSYKTKVWRKRRRAAVTSTGAASAMAQPVAQHSTPVAPEAHVAPASEPRATSSKSTLQAPDRQQATAAVKKQTSPAPTPVAPVSTLAVQQPPKQASVTRPGSVSSRGQEDRPASAHSRTRSRGHAEPSTDQGQGNRTVPRQQRNGNHHGARGQSSASTGQSQAPGSDQEPGRGAASPPPDATAVATPVAPPSPGNGRGHAPRGGDRSGGTSGPGSAHTGARAGSNPGSGQKGFDSPTPGNRSAGGQGDRSTPLPSVVVVVTPVSAAPPGQAPAHGHDNPAPAAPGAAAAGSAPTSAVPMATQGEPGHGHKP